MCRQLLLTLAAQGPPQVATAQLPLGSRSFQRPRQLSWVLPHSMGSSAGNSAGLVQGQAPCQLSFALDTSADATAILPVTGAGNQ